MATAISRAVFEDDVQGIGRVVAYNGISNGYRELAGRKARLLSTPEVAYARFTLGAEHPISQHGVRSSEVYFQFDGRTYFARHLTLTQSIADQLQTNEDTDKIRNSCFNLPEIIAVGAADLSRLPEQRRVFILDETLARPFIAAQEIPENHLTRFLFKDQTYPYSALLAEQGIKNFPLVDLEVEGSAPLFAGLSSIPHLRNPLSEETETPILVGVLP